MAQYLDLNGLTTYHNKIKPSLQKAASAYSDTEAFKNGDKPLVSPAISTNTWAVKNASNTANIPGTYNGTWIEVPAGAKVTYAGKWKWVSNSSYKNPENVSGSWGTTLPANNTESGNLTSEIIAVTSDSAQDVTAASVTLSAKRKGLMINGQKIVGATGNDTTTASAGVRFRDNLYYGNVTTSNPSGSVVAGLSTILTNGKAHTFTATTNSSQYFCYAYPKVYGELSSIVADGADPIKDNFNAPITVQVANKAGLTKEYYVYVSANKGAFSNNSLAFK